MRTFPFFVNLEQKQVLIIGAGAIARHKVEQLTGYGAQITVVAPTLHPDLAGREDLRFRVRVFEESDLEGMDFVILCVSDLALCEQVAELCRRRKILLNAVDAPAYCTFLFPSLLQRGPLCVAVSTNGASPHYAAQLRRELEAHIPEGIEGVLDQMQTLREELKQTCPDQQERARVLKQALQTALQDLSVPEEER